MASSGSSFPRTAQVAVVIALIIGLVIGVVAAPLVTPAPPGVVEKTVTVTPPAKTVTVTPPAKTVEKTVEVPVGLTGEIKIGSILPLTGALASYGENSKVAQLIGEKEVNEFLKRAGAPITIKLVIEDTETKPDVALEKLKSLAAKGITIIIGPQTSAEVRNLKGYADANKILMVSQSSTAPELAIPDDYVYRFCPDDTVQGPALSRIMYQDGIRYLVPVWRGDAWGDGLKKTVVESFKALGGEVVEGVRYAPEAKEFSAEVRALSTAVQDLVDKYGADKVGVDYIAFAEAVTFFTQARDYDILWKVRWYGSDGTAQLDELVKEPLGAEFAVATRFLSPIFAATKSEKYTKLVDQVKAELGRVPDTYAIAAYDEVWVLTYALLSVGKYDATAVKNVLPDIVRTYFGASGWIVLNPAGDRAFADYELWVINEAYEWEWIGTYVFATESVTYF